MKHRIQKLLLVAIFITAQLLHVDISHAQNLDTRKGYDLRGYGFDSAMAFIARHYPELPIIVTVITYDDKLIEAVKNIIRDLDRQGYENIALILHDSNPKFMKDKPNAITFYRIGDPITCLRKGEDYWFSIFIKHKNMETVRLENTKNKLPYTSIKLMIKQLFKN